jgi:hypothetical protein
LSRRARLRSAAHEGRARAREVALAPIRMRRVELVRDDEAEHGVAEELEALVAASAVLLVAERGVGERELAQSRVAERVAEPSLELRGAHATRPAIQPPPSTSSPR